MRQDIDVFELLKETESLEAAERMAIKKIESNPNVIHQLDVFDGVIDDKIAEFIAYILYYGNQYKDRVQNKGLLSEKDSDLIVKEYVRLSGKDVKTDLKEILSSTVIDIE